MSSDYKLYYKRPAKRFLKKQDKPTQRRIIAATEKLKDNSPKGDIKPLRGQEGLYRLRVGTYRVLFHLDNENNIISIENIGNRGDIYKNLIHEDQADFV